MPLPAALIPHLVIFDCDGVLVDSEDLQAEVFASALNAVGITCSAAYCRSHFTGLSLAACFRAVQAVSGRSLPESFAADLVRATRHAFEERLQPMPGAQLVLAALSIAGIRFAVASNGSLEKMRHSLGCTGLLPMVRERLFSASGLPPKPAPDVFLLVARRFAVAPSRVWVVEDSAAGISAARNAGMVPWELCAGGGARGRLPSLPALLELL